MKKALRIILPILISIAILSTAIWYFFVYDKELTRDMLLSCARYFEDRGNHSTAQWFYDTAYAQHDDNDAIAIELANYYKENGNYTKAEYTLYKAIQDGGGLDLYIALSKMYVEQDKLLDAMNLLNNVTGSVKDDLDKMRPEAPKASPDPDFYSQFISVDITAQSGTLYVNANGQYPSVKTDKYQGAFPLKEGENTIYAVAVSQEGLVSPLAIYGYTLGGIIEQIQFTDNAIESQVRQMLGVADSTAIFSNDLWGITEFVVPEDAKSLDDLKHMTSLEKLYINDIVSGQLSVLSVMPNLKELSVIDVDISTEEVQIIGTLVKLTSLTLNGCGLTTTAHFSGLTSITFLDLSNNTIRDISALSYMSGLTELHMNHNAINNLSALKDCTQLTVLDIAYNDLAVLSPVYNLTNLSWIDASNNAITSIEGIGNLNKLERLYISTNQLTDISPVSRCTKLFDIKCASNQLADISVLANLPGLMYIDFSRNQVTQLPEFSKECELVTIDGSHNLLRSIEQLAGLAMLNNVYMDYNSEISSVAELATCFLLIRVDVYGTKVTDVSALTDLSIIVNYDPTR